MARHWSQPGAGGWNGHFAPVGSTFLCADSEVLAGCLACTDVTVIVVGALRADGARGDPAQVARPGSMIASPVTLNPASCLQTLPSAHGTIHSP